MRRIRRKWLLVGLGVYAALWAATAVWGPAAMIARQREFEDNYYRSDPLGPDAHRSELYNFVVPAPSVVIAEWRHDGRPFGMMSCSSGDRWGVLLPGRFWVVREWNFAVRCG